MCFVETGFSTMITIKTKLSNRLLISSVNGIAMMDSININFDKLVIKIQELPSP